MDYVYYFLSTIKSKIWPERETFLDLSDQKIKNQDLIVMLGNEYIKQRKQKPSVLSVESGEIEQSDIDLMQSAWHEIMAESPEPPSDESQKGRSPETPFWCSFGLSKDSQEDDEYKVISQTTGDYMTIEKYQKIPETEKLMDLAKKILTELNIPFSDKDHYIEFHHTMVPLLGMAAPKFHWHIDDGGAVNSNTVAVLFYLYKDPNMIGGNLFWNPDGEHEKGKKLINIESGTTIIMPGNTPHCPEIIQHGYNCDKKNRPQERKLIVFFFRDTTREFKKK